MTTQHYPDYKYPSDPDFGKRFVKAWRYSKYADLSQAELAPVFGVSRSSISTWVNGLRTPSTPCIKKIAKEFEINPDWLYTGREPMRPGPIDEYVDIAQRWMKLDPETHKTVSFIIGLLERGAIEPMHLEDQVRQLISADM